MRKIIILVSAAALSGCLTSGVIQTGPDSYMAREHSTAFSIDPGGGGAIANATKLAGEHCTKLAKYLVVRNTNITRIGAGAQAIVNFECLDSEDRDYVRPKLTPVPQNGAQIVPVPVPVPVPSQANTPKPSSGGSGTGFFINAQGYVLTNQHVVDSCKRLTVRTPVGTTAVGQVIAADATNDLAVVQSSATTQNFASFEKSTASRQGDEVIVYGFPLSNILSSSGTLTTGTINALSGLGDDSRYFQFSAPIQPGNSGGDLPAFFGPQ
jgi:S1-C subfamily serine protease